MNETGTKSKYANVGAANGFFGRKHSVATRAKMRAAWQRNRVERICSLKKAGAKRANNPVLKAAHAARNKQLAKDPKWRKAIARANRKLAKSAAWQKANAEQRARLVKNPEWLRKNKEHLAAQRNTQKWLTALRKANSKSIRQLEKEATRVAACLIHPAHGVANRIYRLRHGEFSPRGNSGGLRVCHTCDTPKCIEDRHHFLGTQKDNVQDAVKKGRHSGFRKGGVRFSGPHTEETRRKISEASKRSWREGKH